MTAAAEAAGKAKHVYVLKFFGDVTASQVSTLRQEVTAVLRTVNVSRGDEGVLVREQEPDHAVEAALALPDARRAALPQGRFLDF